MLVSRPLAEKRQISAVATPEDGRSSGNGFPAREQESLRVENAPRAATFKSRSLPGSETPAVVGSTTTISLPPAVGAELESAIVSSEALGAATSSETLLDLAELGF